MSEKILFVDDEEDFELLISQRYRKMIDSEKFEIFFSKNGFEALETLEDNLDINIIFSDIRMDGMTGIELLNKIRNLYPMKKVIILTAYGDMDNIRMAMNMGAYDFIIKPIDFQDLDNTISRVIQEVERNKDWLMAMAENTVLKTFNERLEKEIEIRKTAEKELDTTLEKLKISNEDLQQFANSVSHDLQEPLRMISGYLNLLKERYINQLDEDAHEFINYAVDGAKRMSAMIHDLLDYSRVKTQGDKFIPVDMNNVVILALQNLSVSIKESKAEINFSKLPRIMGDKAQLIRLFQNIISNGIKYQKPGSNNPPKINIKAEHQANQILISISDNGIGIENKYFDDIFHIFRRLHKRGKYSGTGVGLSISKRIVERHSGTMWLESELGKGSVFYFTLPPATE